MGTEKVICDTDVIIDYLDNRNKRYQSTVSTLEEKIGLSNILISAITKIELFKGAQNKQDLYKIERQITKFSSLRLNKEITDIAIDLIYKYNLSHGLAISDSFIAATSLFTGLPLYSYNLKDFRFIDGIQLYK